MSNFMEQNPLRVEFKDFVANQKLAFNFVSSLDALTGIEYPVRVYLQEVDFPFSIVSAVHRVNVTSTPAKHTVYF